MKGFLRIVCMLFLMVFVVNVGYADVTTTIEKVKIEQSIDVDNQATISVPEVMLIEYDNCQAYAILVKSGEIETKTDSFSKDADIYEINKGLITAETDDFNLQKQLVSNSTNATLLDGKLLKTDNTTIKNLALYRDNMQIERFVKHKGKLEKTYYMSV